MKTLLTVILTALVLFALSATASWLWIRSKTPPAEASTGADLGEAGNKQMAGMSSTAPQSTTPQRTAVKPPYTPGTDEAVQLANNLRERLAGVREKEAELVAKQKQMEIIRQDIRGERAAIDELRKQVNEELKAADERLKEVERKSIEFDEKKEKESSALNDLENRRTKIKEQENNNVRQDAEIINTMEPAAAAKIIQQMADTGKMDTAVKLLGTMKERRAAAVLAEIPDPGLAAQLLDKLTQLVRPQAPMKK